MKYWAMLLFLGSTSFGSLTAPSFRLVTSEAFIGKEAQILGDKDDGIFIVVFQATSTNGDIFIPARGICWSSGNGSAVVPKACSLSAYNRSSKDTATGFGIMEGETRTFDWRIVLQPEQSANVFITIEAINWSQYLGVECLIAEEVSDFKTPTIAMRSIPIPETKRWQLFVAVICAGGLTARTFGRRRAAWFLRVGSRHRRVK